MKASDLVALPLQLGSAVRRRRIFHPLGVLASGHIERNAPPGRGLPIESGEIIGRVSKAVGLPGNLPDLIGLAWRMPTPAPDAPPWDVLMVSAGGPGMLARFGLLPTTKWTNTTMSTLMPLRYRDGSWWLRAQLRTEVAGGLSLDTLRDTIEAGELVFDIQQAHGTESFRPLATLTLTDPIPTDDDHDVSFDPTRNSLPGIALRPEWLTAIRERAYLRSRHGRDAPDDAALS